MPPEVEKKVTAVLGELKEEHGYVPRTGASFMLAQEFSHGNVSPDKLRRIFTRFSTEPYLYKGARDGIRFVLKQGGRVIVWTDDYFEPVVTSRIGDLRRELPFEERKRLQVAAAEHKIPLLPGIIDHAQKDNASAIFVIDNNSNNLKKGANLLVEHNLQIPIFFVYKGDALELQCTFDYPLQFAPILSIPSVTQGSLQRLFTETGHEARRISVVSDFNETLVDTPAIQVGLQAVLVKELTARQPQKPTA